MAYDYTGRAFAVQMEGISGNQVTVWWYDPRTGEAIRIGTYANEGVVSFNPPGAQYDGDDWVLVLDDGSRNFGTPGVLALK